MNRISYLAFLTALAALMNIAESLFFRALPLPFLRLGLANVVTLYLLMQHRFVLALLLSILKTLLGGIFTFTLLSPSTLLSLGGGLSAYLIMAILIKGNFGLSIIGISISGAVMHNLVQVLLVRYLIIRSESILMLLPIMLGLGLVSGSLVAYLSNLLSQKMASVQIWDSVIDAKV